MQPERRTHDRADGLARVQRRIRVLEDHLHVAADGPKVVALHPRDVPAVEPDGAVRRVVQAHGHAGERALAAPGLADEPDGFAGIDVEVDAVDGVHRADLLLEDDAAGDREMLHDPLQPE